MFDLISDDPALNEYRNYFPHCTPTIFQQELILRDVENLEAWRETLEFWAGNDFRSGSILKMINYYNEVCAKYVPCKPQWQIDRDNCKQCDERGYVLLDGKHQVCKHGE